jgi:single-strand DNA-binding protein
MANLNKVFLMGNLTRDPELRYLQSGTAVCDFGMAINRRWKGSSGEQKEDVCFVDVTFFGRTAEVISEFMKKGRPIFVEGRLRLDAWTGKDGQKRSKLGVVGESMQFLDTKGGGVATGAAPRTSPADDAPDAVPDKDLDVDDGSIPF